VEVSLPDEYLQQLIMNQVEKQVGTKVHTTLDNMHLTDNDIRNMAYNVITKIVTDKVTDAVVSEALKSPEIKEAFNQLGLAIADKMFDTISGY
jgi:citrate lyase gamma subunit